MQFGTHRSVWFVSLVLSLSTLSITNTKTFPGPPQIKSYSSTSYTVRSSGNNLLYYYNTTGITFSLTVECNALYPVYWHTEDSPGNEFPIFSPVNKRATSSVNQSEQRYNFTTIVNVTIDLRLFEASNEVNYTCQSVERSCVKNSIHIWKFGLSAPNTLIVATLEFSTLINQLDTKCSPNTTTKDEIGNSDGLKSYLNFSSKKDSNAHQENVTCSDILHIDELIEQGHLLSSDKSDAVIIIRCKAHKDYLAQGMRLEYQIGRDRLAFIEDTGENYQLEKRFPYDSYFQIQKVICYAPYWNNENWCNSTFRPRNVSLELLKRSETSITTAEIIIPNSTAVVDTNEAAKNNSPAAIVSTTEGILVETPVSTAEVVIQNYSTTIESVNDIGHDFESSATADDVHSTESLAGINENELNKTEDYTTENNTEDSVSTSTLTISWGIGAIILLLIMVIIATMIFASIIKRKRDSSRNKPVLPEKGFFMTVRHCPLTMSPINQRNNGFYEILQDKLTIDENCILGRGTFGIVLKGVLRTQSQPIDVAVKIAKNDSEFAVKSLKKELKVASKMKKHDNIVELIGAVTQDVENGSFHMILEYCANGNLRDYLRKHKSSFKNITLENPGEEVGKERMVNYFSTKELISWSLDIARGMKYLSSQNIVHGDLACRNVLLSDTRVAKLTDFGLSKQLEEYYYIIRREVPMPWKWMAYESLQYQKFSTKSDIWSYGVTLWEIFSLGDTPWVGCQWGDEFLETLVKGIRLKKPEYASGEIYHIMRQCWRLETILRPHFGDSAKNFEHILHKFTVEEMEEKVSIDIDGVTEYSNEIENYLIPKQPTR